MGKERKATGGTVINGQQGEDAREFGDSDDDDDDVRTTRCLRRFF